MKTADSKNLNYLLPKTREVLLVLSKLEVIQDYCFVGGSALAVYLQHRLSEDIDFFTWNKVVDAEQILAIVQNKFKKVVVESLSKKQLDLQINGVKVTWFASGWDELKAGNILTNKLKIASLDTLLVMKVNTLFLRAKYRDYYDLYVLNKEIFTIQEIEEMSLVKVKSLTVRLLETALVFTDDIEDEKIAHLQPKYKITLKAISKHFSSQFKKTKRK